MMIHIVVLWVVTPCCYAVGYQCFRGPNSLHILFLSGWRWREHGPLLSAKTQQTTTWHQHSTLSSEM